ncbi:unnamed protein product [Symbiodinium pilosum]|uniref:Uncharacterized protein n=1 Tax=Symbiodinium pilosum TaxID=2952 RepID=A0A812WXN6_SYMPI|nr:unnamed protein product [Symbiodinium pilosum]
MGGAASAQGLAQLKGANIADLKALLKDLPADQKARMAALIDSVETQQSSEFKKLIGKFQKSLTWGDWGGHSFTLTIEESGRAVFEERSSEFRDSENWFYKVGRVSLNNDIITFTESRMQGESMGPGGNRSYHEKVVIKRFRRLAGGSLALLADSGEVEKMQAGFEGKAQEAVLVRYEEEQSLTEEMEKLYGRD